MGWKGKSFFGALASVCLVASTMAGTGVAATHTGAVGNVCVSSLSGQRIAGDLTVPAGSFCQLTNDTIDGSVFVYGFADILSSSVANNVLAYPNSEAGVDVGTKVGGDFLADGMSVGGVVCGAKVAGSVIIENSGADPDLCGPIGGDLLLIANRSAVKAIHFRVRGSLVVLDNVGTVTVASEGFAGSGSIVNNKGKVFLDNNSFVGSLSCVGNTFVGGSNNTSKTGLTGQCAGLG